MIKWIYAMIFILSCSGFLSYGASIEINSLAHDTCWVQNLNNGRYKLASFNESTAFEINTRYREKFNELIKKEIPEMDIEQSDPQALYLHCSSFGMALVTNIETSMGSFCSWARIEENKINLISLGLSEEKSFCHGHKVGELLLMITNIEKAKQALTSQKWKDHIISFEVISKNVLKISVSEQFRYRIDEVAIELLNGSNDDWLKSADYNFINHPVGEAMRLDSFSRK